MKSLTDVSNFGGTDADNDDILLQAFEDHEAYVDVLERKRHMIIGKKGSGKTAIFKKLLTTKSYNFFAYGLRFQTIPGIIMNGRPALASPISINTRIAGNT